MRDPTFDLLKALRAQQPIAFIEYHSTEERDELVASVREMLEDQGPTRLSSDVEDCFSDDWANTSLVLVPILGEQTETEIVETLAGRRDQLCDRSLSKPIVVMLLHNGDALTRLRQLPGLANWVAAIRVDVEDLEEKACEQDRQDFAAQTKLTPKQWLEKDRLGEFEDTLDTNLLRQRARRMANDFD